jgi:tRNA A-37 threonylcarbamoyl transferase component Bud32
VDLGRVSDDEDDLPLGASAALTGHQPPHQASSPRQAFMDSSADSNYAHEGSDAIGAPKDAIGATKHSSSSLSSSSALVSTTTGLDEAPVIDAHWLLNFSDCYFINQLGKGNSSTVFLGEYQGQQVAIKVLRQETHKRDLDDFKKEMEIMCSLRSPYIVHFFGATVQPKLCIVLEYCSRGTLFHYLHDDLNYVDWTMALRWLIESARGINTLHLWKPQIVHRDLKTLNLLLDEKMQVKVCDFGLSRYVSGEHDQSTFFKMRGTFAYFAPEVYQGRPFTSKSDVYSFGIILWEIVHRIIFGTHTRPFAEFKHINHDFQIIIQAAKGLRPTLPFSTPRILVKLYEDCVASDPDARPTCAEIIERLEGITTFYEQHMDTWDALVKGGVRIRPTAPALRRDSQASPSRGSRAELLRTPIASRNLKDDLTRRGVTANLLREKSLSASSSGYGTDSAVGSGSSGSADRASRASIQFNSAPLSASSSSSTPAGSPKPASSRHSAGDNEALSVDHHPATNTGGMEAGEPQSSSESPSLTASSSSIVAATSGSAGDRMSTGNLDTSTQDATPTLSPPSPSPIEKKARSTSAAPAPNSPSSSPKRNASPGGTTKRKKKVFDVSNPPSSMPSTDMADSTSASAPTDTATTDTDTASGTEVRERTPSPTPVTSSPTATPTKNKRADKATAHLKSGSEISSGEDI